MSYTICCMLATLMILIGVVFRLLPHLPNFTPITAMALFGSAKLGKKYGLLVPFVALVLSDYLLLYINPYQVDLSGFKPLSSMFHSTTLFVWGSFFISGLIGLWLRKRAVPRTILGGTLLASLQFFIITNFGVWISGYYPQSLAGFLDCYIQALPFFRMTVLGDLFYSALFFGGYALINRLILKLSFKNTD